MQFEPHNYIHGRKAVFDEQILAPRFGGLEPVTKAPDLSSKWVVLLVTHGDSASCFMQLHMN